MMTTKDLIRAELEQLGEDDLRLVYGLIRRMRDGRPADDVPTGGILSKLGEIQIDGPEDLSANHDHYRVGVGD